MSEETIFEVPGVRITTKQIEFYDATFEIDYLASTDVSERYTTWSYIPIFALTFAVVVATSISPILGFFAGILCLAIPYFFPNLLPKEYVITIKMTDKMFYEVITRTREEAETIQRYVDEAIDISEKVKADTVGGSRIGDSRVL